MRRLRNKVYNTALSSLINFFNKSFVYYYLSPPNQEREATGGGGDVDILARDNITNDVYDRIKTFSSFFFARKIG